MVGAIKRSPPKGWIGARSVVVGGADEDFDPIESVFTPAAVTTALAPQRLTRGAFARYFDTKTLVAVVARCELVEEGNADAT